MVLERIVVIFNYLVGIYNFCLLDNAIIEVAL